MCQAITISGTIRKHNETKIKPNEKLGYHDILSLHEYGPENDLGVLESDSLHQTQHAHC
jgi:hypothetical protein